MRIEHNALSQRWDQAHIYHALAGRERRGGGLVSDRIQNTPTSQFLAKLLCARQLCVLCFDLRLMKAFQPKLGDFLSTCFDLFYPV